MRQIVSSTNLTSKAYDVLRQAIISGELVPGELYSAYKLSDQLGVSRTPVREALLRLADEGMVAFERNRGIRVLQTDLHDLEEIGTVRLLLEVPATHRAATRMDDKRLKLLRREQVATEKAAANGDEIEWARHDQRFHALILEASGNHRLASFVEKLRDLVHLRGVYTAGRSRSLSEIALEHREILGAIERRDAVGAGEAMRVHLMNTMRLLLSQEAHTEPSDITLSWAEYVAPRRLSGPSEQESAEPDSRRV